MKKTYCRKDIMETYSISRRVIEGYENNNLIKPIGKNEKGVLIYDEETFKKIGLIRLCQKFGFESKKIKRIINTSDDSLKKELNKQIDVLNKKKKNIEDLIEILKEVLKIKNIQSSSKIIEIFKSEN